MVSQERVKLYFILLVVNVTVLFAVSAIPTNPQMGQQILNSLNSTVSSNQGIVGMGTSIAGHNFFLSLFMSFPFIGIPVGLFILADTGYAFSAIGSYRGVPGVVLPGIEAFLPFFWLEFISYTAMMTESFFMTKAILDGSWRRELNTYLIVVGVVAIILTISGFIESSFISLGV
ncbi:MAG: hypothetical protein RXS23_04590 [Metallosphaera yellowstonensis]|jgi:hypothetical protein|uniref:Integral membrane protein DUF95 n=1 Tax=Metallosphaera yellowstonensis MK1 TaxID=671065 RepID=H2C3B1_9CREN|nr:hypothetical protein [Metallosphaera yellowstonensis]EHP70732.1 Integral membrane protein DUF95 [Metallosphaera yellowstonensis MK1]